MEPQLGNRSDDSSPESSSSSAASPAASPGGSRRFALKINLASCKYPVLRVVQRQLGWVETDDEDAHVHWCDTSAGTERLVRLSRPQKLNHFPGMLEIARKKGLARNLANMRALFPQEYDFSPRTFLLPEMMEAFEEELLQGGAGAGGEAGTGGAADVAGSARPTFILKLDNGSMGRGIKLVQTYSQAAAALPTFDHENVVASQYIDRPLLIDGKKFDLRIYVMVRCCNPLRVFLCREGLVRFCTEPYQPPASSNLHNKYSHLTNYAVNKMNPAFIFNQDAEEAGTGSKWTITAFAEWMRAQGHDFDALWRQVAHIVVKTVIAAQPMLQYQYDCATKADDVGLTCFELLGFDVLVDENLRPWLLEVNHSPSLTTDTPLDLEIKSRVVREVLALAGVQPGRIRAELAARERAKAARLYTGHAACVVHAEAHAASGCSASPAKLAGPGPAASGSTPATPAGPAAAGCGDGHGRSGANSPGPRSGAVSPGPRSGAASPGPQSGAASPGPKQAPTSPGAGCCFLGPAVEPARGSAEWEAAQRVYEDAHLGQFDRIMPPENDPDRAALYEKLLGGALQVFYRSTTQGRNQLRLVQIKERRQQEEAEAAARQEAQQRRAESLRAWMAAVCQRHREERLLRAAAAAAEAAAGAAGDLDGLVDLPDGGTATDSSDGSAMDSRACGSPDWVTASEAAKVLQSHFQVARLGLPSSHGPPAGVGSGGQVLRAVRRGAPAPQPRSSATGGSAKRLMAQDCRKETPQGFGGTFLSVSGTPVGSSTGQQCVDSALTSAAGCSSSDGGGGGGGSGRGRGSISARGSSSGGSGPPRRPLYDPFSQSSRGDSVTLEDVIVQRLTAAAEAEAAEAAGASATGEPRQQLPPRPGSAALAAWAAASSRQQGCTPPHAHAAVSALAPPQQGAAGGVSLHLQHLQLQLQPQPWQQQAWDACGRQPRAAPARPIGSSTTFLDRVATFTQQQQQLSSEASKALPGDSRLHSSSSCCSSEGADGGSSQGSLTGSGSGTGSDPDLAACSADGSVLLPSGSTKQGRPATPDVGGSLDATYIPPTLLKALHTVRMSPRLLSGLRDGPQGAAPAAAGGLTPAQAVLQQGQGQGRAPWRAAGTSRRQSQASSTSGAAVKQAGQAVSSSTGTSSSSSSSGSGSGSGGSTTPRGASSTGRALAAIEVPFRPGPELGSPTTGIQLPPVRGSPAAPGGAKAAQAPAAAVQRSPASKAAAPQRGGLSSPAAAAQRSPASKAAAAPRGALGSPVTARLAGAVAAAAAAAAASSPGAAAGSSAAGPCGTGTGTGTGTRGSQQYRASIEQQAVQSVALLIADMIK